jgi:SOS response regulatory protein OraA/RecX
MTKSKKAKRMRSILLKGFGFTEIAEAVDSECNELASRCVSFERLNLFIE